MFDPLQCASAAFLVGTAALLATGTAWSQQQVVMSASFSRRRRRSLSRRAAVPRHLYGDVDAHHLRANDHAFPAVSAQVNGSGDTDAATECIDAPMSRWPTRN
jgi:hypothetical protein